MVHPAPPVDLQLVTLIVIPGPGFQFRVIETPDDHQSGIHPPAQETVGPEHHLAAPFGGQAPDIEQSWRSVVWLPDPGREVGGSGVVGQHDGRTPATQPPLEQPVHGHPTPGAGDGHRQGQSGQGRGQRPPEAPDHGYVILVTIPDHRLSSQGSQQQAVDQGVQLVAMENIVIALQGQSYQTQGGGPKGTRFAHTADRQAIQLPGSGIRIGIGIGRQDIHFVTRLTQGSGLLEDPLVEGLEELPIADDADTSHRPLLTASLKSAPGLIDGALPIPYLDLPTSP